MRELKRILNIKFLIVFTIAVILNVVIFTNMQTAGSNISTIKQNVNDYNALINSYELDSTNLNLDTVIEKNDNLLHQIASGKSDENIVAAQMLQDKIEHIKKHTDLMISIQKNADNLVQFSIFSDVNSFSYNNIIKTKSDFDNVKNQELKVENDLAAEALNGYYYTYIIALIISVMLVYRMFEERENSMWDIVFASALGRERIAVCRMIIFSVTTFLIVTIINVTTVLASYLIYGGWSSLLSNIQQLNDCSYVTIPVNILEYFIMIDIVGWLVVWSISLLVLVLFTFIKKRNLSMSVVCIIVGVETLLYTSIESQSIYSGFKTFNIVSLLNINNLINTYKNWGLNTHVLSTVQTIIIILIIIIIVCSITIITGMTKQYPHSNQSKIESIISKIIVFHVFNIQRKLSKCKQLTLELYKFLFSDKGIIIIIVVGCITAYFCNLTRVYFTDGMKHRDEIYIQMGGSDFTEIEDYINGITEDYTNKMQIFNEVRSKYESDLASSEELYNASVSVQSAREQYNFIAEFIEKVEYVNDLEENNIKAYLISDRGYEEMFGQYAKKRELILLLATIMGTSLLIIGSMSREYISGMSVIIRSSECGRLKMIGKKILAGGLISIILFLVVYTTDYLILYHYYGMPYLDAPVVSLSFMKDCRMNHISIGLFLLFNLLSKLGCIVMTIGTTFFSSIIIGKKRQKNVIIVLVLLLGIFAVLFASFTYIMQFIVGFIGLGIGMCFVILTAIIWNRS